MDVVGYVIRPDSGWTTLRYVGRYVVDLPLYGRYVTNVVDRCDVVCYVTLLHYITRVVRCRTFPGPLLRYVVVPDKFF